MSGSYTQTPNLGLFKPTPNSDTGTWGIHLNANADVLDGTLSLTTGGTVTGPLYWTATGGTTPRAAQDRTAERANVLDFGADPTGATNSTTAIRAAVATGKAVYMPAGMYLVTDNIALNKGQIVYGDGREQSMFRVNSTSFNLAAVGVISMYQGEVSSQLVDIGIGFTQPDTSSRASLVQFPPAIFAQGAARGKLIRVRIDGSYNGIDARANTVLSIEDLEVGAINIGMLWGSLNSGDGNGAKDYNHWGKVSFFPYGFNGTPNISNLYSDGNTVAAQIGEIDGLMCASLSGYNCRVVFTADSTNHTYGFGNLSLDAPGGILDIQGSPMHLGITNLVLNTSTNAAPKLHVGGGNVFISNGRFSSLGTDAVIRVTGGFLIISGGYLYQASTSVMAAEVTGGQMVLSGMDFATGGAITAPFIQQTGGSLAISNCHFLAGGSGVGVRFTSDTSANKLIGLSLNSMTVTLPGTQALGQYGWLPLTGGILSGPLTATQVNVATAAGCNIRSGPGAPGSTQPAGSLYMRTDGAAGTRLYVSQGGGTWAPVAGV